MNTFNPEEMELLAAGYVLDDLDEAEKLQVEELIKTSPTMREEIRKSMAVMGVLATDAQPMSPPVSLKNQVSFAFEEKKKSLLQTSKKTLIQLDNWFQQLFDEGWQTVSEVLETPSIDPAFRNYGVEGARSIYLGSNNVPIILIVRIRETQESERDIAVEILPELKNDYLPNKLQLILLDADGDVVMEATTRRENQNLKFDFSGTCGETFSIKLELSDDYFQENFLL